MQSGSCRKWWGHASWVYIGLCSRKGDTVNLDPGPGPYKFLFKTFECQCPHLATGKCLALFRDMGVYRECWSIVWHRGFWTRRLLLSLSSRVQCLMCAHFFPFPCGRMQPPRVSLSCSWETRLIFVRLLLQRERSASQRTLEKSWPW